MQDRVVLAIMTLVSERVMRPGYGTRVRASSFENNNAAVAMIKKEISQGFSQMLPYLTLISVDPSISQDDGHLDVSITYKYGSSQNPETVTIKTDILSQAGDVITEVPYGNK